MLLAKIALLLVTAVDQVDSDFLLRRHEEYLRSIHSIKCAVDHYASIDGGNTWMALADTCEMARSGEREKIHTIWYSEVEAHKEPRRLLRPSHWVAIFEPERLWSTDGFDPANPPKEPVTVLDQVATGTKIKGLIRPGQIPGPYGYKGALAADNLLLFLVDPGHSLGDLVVATGKVRPVARQGADGEQLWELSLKDDKSLFSYKVALSPKRGYAIVEVQKQVNGNPRGSEKKTVKDFVEPEPGIFLPKTYEIRWGKDPKLVFETRVRDVSVNVPIADADLSFRFPEGIHVGDATKNVHHVWGKDGPAKTMSTDEFNEWHRGQVIAARGALRSNSLKDFAWEYIALAVVTSVLIAVGVLRHRQRARLSMG